MWSRCGKVAPGALRHSDAVKDALHDRVCIHTVRFRLETQHDAVAQDIRRDRLYIIRVLRSRDRPARRGHAPHDRYPCWHADWRRTAPAPSKTHRRAPGFRVAMTRLTMYCSSSARQVQTQNFLTRRMTMLSTAAPAGWNASRFAGFASSRFRTQDLPLVVSVG